MENVAIEQEIAPIDPLPTGPLEKVYVIWLAGMSCDGCSISLLGATTPPLERLMAGTVPGVPKLVVSHTALSLESGHEYLETFFKAERGELDAPYVVVLEGSVPDENLNKDNGGYFVAVGQENGRQVPTAEWLTRLVPTAAAVISVGTCATWGGIPAAYGNVTGSMGLMDYLGKDFRSAFGLPVINIPGCPPIGDNITETISAILLFLQGLTPLPEFDELGRPAWLFGDSPYGDTVHTGCPRAGHYEEGNFASEPDQHECLVKVGCWGPVVQCNMGSKGAINGIGGCMQMGGVCIGCTMPGFPDKFSPRGAAPPGSLVSGAFSNVVGSIIKPLRNLTQMDKNRTIRWTDDIPSGWAPKEKRTLLGRLWAFLYKIGQKREIG